jgi:hypothetical protein
LRKVDGVLSDHLVGGYMAEKLFEEEIAGVRLMTLNVSEDEVAVYIACLNYVLSHANHRVLEQVIGAYRGEMEAMRDDLSLALEDSEVAIDLDEPVVEPA